MNNAVKDAIGGYDHIPTPQVLGRIFGQPSMQALLSLSRVEHVKATYEGQGMDFTEVLNMFKKEDFNPETGEVLPGALPTYASPSLSSPFDRDIVSLEAEINSWKEIRELWDAGFLQSNAVRALYASMVQSGKVTHEDLIMTDRTLFGYMNMEMETLIKFGFTVFTPASPFRDHIVGVLNLETVEIVGNK